MSMKHTPGPWSWSEDGYDLRPAAGYMGASLVIATTEGMLVQSFNPKGFEASMAEVNANKALIAAAPDMLAALLLITQADPCIAKTTDDELRAAMQDQDEEQEVREQAHAFLAARAAIAKATGGQA